MNTKPEKTTQIPANDRNRPGSSVMKRMIQEIRCELIRKLPRLYLLKKAIQKNKKIANKNTIPISLSLLSVIRLDRVGTQNVSL